MPEKLFKKKSCIIKLTAIALTTIVLLSCSGDSGEEEHNLSEGDSFVIPTSEITGTAGFYPVEVNGTEMEIIAVKNSAGNIRTAFNTCQVCYSSGRGHYVAGGSTLVCQNCKSRFTMAQIGVISGGCNPYPIFSSDRTETDEGIYLSYDFLAKSAVLFSDWKVYQ